MFGGLFLLSLFASTLLLGRYNIQISWLYVFLITDPGGFVSTYLDKNVLQFGGVFFIDILSVLIVLALISGPYKLSTFFKDRFASGIFYALLFFSLYKLFFWGLIVPPGKSILDFIRYTLIRERDSIFGFLIIIPVYLFALRDLKVFFKIIVIFGSLILFLSGLSFIFGINIVQTVQIERYSGSGIIRLILLWYGILNLLIPLSILVYTVKIKIPHKNILFIGGVMAIINIVITLTKNLYIFIFGMIFSTIYLGAKIFKIQVSKSVVRFSNLVLVSLVVIVLIFPSYLSFAAKVSNDILLLITTGETSDGSTSRTWQIEALTYEIVRNPLFGTGQGYDQLSIGKFDVNQFDASDLPLLAHIMQYGIIGISIYLLYYIRLFKVIKVLYRKFKTIPKFEILTKYKYEFLFSIAAISYFAGYFIKGFTIFIELTRGINRIEMSIYTALLLASLRRIFLANIKEIPDIKSIKQKET